MKKLMKSSFVLSSLVTLLSGTVADAATTDYDYWHQASAYSTGIGYASSSGGVPSSYDNLGGSSTSVLSVNSIYWASSSYGFERARIWSRPNTVRNWLSYAGWSTSVSTISAILQFQGADSRFYIDGSEPAASDTSTVSIPNWAFSILGEMDVYGAAISKVLSEINGFTYASTNVAWPDNNSRRVSYIQWTNTGGLPNMDLSDSYSYTQADQGSQNQSRGASARWKYSLNNSVTYYPVSVVGRVEYEGKSFDGSRYYHYTYGWTDLATGNHQVNKN